MRWLDSIRRGNALPLAFRLLAASLGALLLADVGCADAPPAPRNNVLLIVVDTLRRDRLGVYGHKLATSPSMNALAAEGTVFAHAYTTAPWTQPAVASLFTGRYPSSHGLTTIYQKLDPGETTLAERFASHGYATQGIVSHHLVGRRFNFDQGFEHYSDEDGMRHNAISTEKVTEKAIAALEGMAIGERPFFLFVHYFDPHFYYHDHSDIRLAGPGPGRLRRGLLSMQAMRDLDPPPHGAERRFILDRYDEEIRHTDAGIGQLLSALRKLGLDAGTVIALTSDHGEAIYEHGWLGHTVQLYEEVLAVPLIIRPIRAEAAPRVVEGRVSTLALAPTLLELAGLEAEVDHFQTGSLAPWVRRDEDGKGQKKAPPRDAIFAEVDYRPIPAAESSKRARMQVYIQGRYKLIWDDIEEKVELYDLFGDPGERKNLAEQKPRRVRNLLEAMRAHQESLERSTQPIQAIVPSREEIEALRALGYVGEADDDEPAPSRDNESGRES
jgi:arylsulfatase A-like enzyme